MPSLLSLGHGYSAQALADVLLPLGWTVMGTTRNPQTMPKLAEKGVTPLLWPLQDPKAVLQQATHILISMAPDGEGDPALNHLSPYLRDIRPEWVGYLSTTGVYGDHQGAWVDEGTPLTPSTARGKARVAAEAAWQATGLPLHIFRLAGIYGPKRGPFEKVRNGTARRIMKPDQVFSRIHVEDIAQALAASIAKPRAGAIYNLCDDDPAPPEDVLAYAAQLLGLPLPPEVPWDSPQISPMARSFYAESKRVRNDLMKSELGVRLRYPTYHAGLQALLAAGE